MPCIAGATREFLTKSLSGNELVVLGWVLILFVTKLQSINKTLSKLANLPVLQTVL